METFETTVTGVNWFINKSGAFKPVVMIDSAGDNNKMEHPTGHNARYIKENKISKGAIINVVKSGGLAPTISNVIKPATDASIEDMWNAMQKCPHCGSPLSWNKSGVELCCTNPQCDGHRLAEIIFFYDTIGFEGTGEDTITRIFNTGFKTLKSILDITEEELAEIEGIGKEITKTVLNANAEIKKGIPVTTLMHASNKFPGIGQTKAKRLLNKMNATSLNAFVGGYLMLEDNMHELSFYKSATMTEQAFYDGLKPFYQFIAENRLIILPYNKIVVTGNKYAGIKVCFTGTRNADLEKSIVKNGGEIVSKVSRSITYLIIPNNRIENAKTKKAHLFNIPILTVEEFKKM